MQMVLENLIFGWRKGLFDITYNLANIESMKENGRIKWEALLVKSAHIYM
jgi:hypothetical protein